MPTTLSAPDVAVVAACTLAILGLGAWLGRRQANIDSYFVGDRNVPWWLALASIVATETSTVTFLSVPGLAYDPGKGNLTFLQLALGFIVGRVVVAFLLVPAYLRGKLLSAYQLLRERFSESVQRTASALFLVLRTVADGLRLYLTALLLQQCTGWDGTTSVLVLAAATLVYTYLGGIKAVLWTDLTQLLLYLTGAIVAGACMLSLMGGPGEFLAVGGAAHKFTWLDFSLDPTRAYTFWAGLIGGAFLTMASHGADQLMVQRYLSCRSTPQAQLALTLSGVAVFAQFTLFLLLGVGLFVLQQKGILTLKDGTRNDEVFGAFIVGFLPVGVVGLVIASVFGAAMSTLSSSLNSLANASVADFYKPLTPDRSEGHYLTVSRLLTLFWGTAQVAVALAALSRPEPGSVVNHVLTLQGVATGLVLGLFLLGRLPRPVRSDAALFGLLAGLGVVLIVWRPWLPGGAVLAWPWYAPIGTLTTFGFALGLKPLGARRGASGNRGA
jgi:SSS family solute:Na+ symporter